jgi:hypothetical protein
MWGAPPCGAKPSRATRTPPSGLVPLGHVGRDAAARGMLTVAERGVETARCPFRKSLVSFFSTKGVTLQRHLCMLPKFAHVKSRVSHRQRLGQVVLYALTNLDVTKHVRISVAVGVM